MNLWMDIDQDIKSAKRIILMIARMMSPAALIMTALMKDTMMAEIIHSLLRSTEIVEEVWALVIMHTTMD
jgi:hypothetical protein